jgi:site-specific recombinase XerD
MTAAPLPPRSAAGPAGRKPGRARCEAIAVDYGGYAVTFGVSQLSLLVTVSSICLLTSWSWNLGRLSVGLSDFGGTDDVLLFRTELARLGEVPGVGGDAAGVLARAGASEGQVFALGPDGSYDVELNRFFRELDGWGVRSANSICAYARDVVLFGRFLAGRRGGKSVWQAGQEDLRAYRRARRSGGPGSVSAGTWNRFIAAMDKWAEWAVCEKLIEAAPFRYADVTVWTPHGPARMRVNTERDPGEESAPVRFLPYEDYLLWRDVGLRGLLPDRSPDPAWQGRHGERNAAFADLMVGTGMRLGEASSLLVSELPQPGAGRRTGELLLPSSITKRNRARSVFVSQRVLRRVRQYADIERDELVSRILAGGGYDGAASLILVDGSGRAGLRLAGSSGVRGYARFGVAERLRLARAGDGGKPAGPLWLWLGEDGMPLRRSAWQTAFRRANERCARLGVGVTATPHALRHTFAVHMLGLLLRQTVQALRMRPGETVTSQQVKRLLVGDPLRKLQLLLGHRQIATTFAYLDVLDEAQEIVLSALREWDEEAEALSRVDERETAA